MGLSGGGRGVEGCGGSVGSDEGEGGSLVGGVGGLRPAPDLHCGESPGSEVVLGAPGWEILLIVLKINY